MQLETRVGNMFQIQANCNLSLPASELMIPCSSNLYDSISLSALLSTSNDIEDAESKAFISPLRKIWSDLCISEEEAAEGTLCSGDSEVNTEEEDDYEDNDSVDENSMTRMDPESTYASEIYHYWRASETNNRPSINFAEMMERVQKETQCCDTIVRSLMVNWLVETTEYLEFVPDTLYLAVSYVDRILSINPGNWDRGCAIAIACLMIASKYEEIRHRSKIEKLTCILADQLGCTKAELYKVELDVLRTLEFDITTPTAACFLRLFVHVAAEEEADDDEDPLLQLELQCMASYVAELSLLDYTMNCYAPSLIAASSIFLAKFILNPSKRPWTSTLENSTLYKPSDLHECLQALQQLCRENNHDSDTTTIREKYSRRKYKSVVSKHCPPTIPPDFFHGMSS